MGVWDAETPPELWPLRHLEEDAKQPGIKAWHLGVRYLYTDSVHLITLLLYPPLGPVAAVQIPVADSLGDMVPLYLWYALKVGDRARHLQDTAIGPC